MGAAEGVTTVQGIICRLTREMSLKRPAALTYKGMRITASIGGTRKRPATPLFSICDVNVSGQRSGRVERVRAVNAKEMALESMLASGRCVRFISTAECKAIRAIALPQMNRYECTFCFLWPRLINESAIVTNVAHPILKWAGGKRQILDAVLEHFPSDYRNRSFHEPMFGGGAVTFKIEPSAGTINDVNKRLMDFYRTVRNHPRELIEQNRTHKHNVDYYYDARDRFNAPLKGAKLSRIEEASLLLYLNRTCFNGLFRVNRNGEFNVPFGRYKNPDFIMESAIMLSSRVLKKLDLCDGDFTYVLRKAHRGDLVYFDPPYHPISTTSSFTAYSKEVFGLDEQKRLRDCITRLDERGVKFVLSNSDVREVLDLYEGVSQFRIAKVKARRAINCNGSRRGDVGEILVTNVAEDA